MSENKTIKVALLGLGTVGGGVYKLIQRQKKEMPFKIGANIEVVSILVHNMNKTRDGVESSLLTDKWEDILQNDEIEIVIEVMGGIEPAKTMIVQALEAGKHVISANKDLIAEHGKELFDAAQKNNRDFLFEAAVAGGIPIIRPLKQCLAGNDISEVFGIINGTTNYILTKMTEDHMEFEEALAKATELGYAEADPTADIEGLDAGRKIAIMASIAFHSRVVFSNVYTEGITHITAKDIQYAETLSSVIKLLGVAKNTEDGIEVGVYPMLLPKEHPLASVRDSFNAVFVEGDAIGDAMFYGKGAGELPTASAVMGDLFDIARNISYGCCGRIGCSCFKEIPIKEKEEAKNKFYLRIKVAEQPGVLASVAKVFGDHQVSITRVVQYERDVSKAELVIETDSVKEGDFRQALHTLETMDIIHKIGNVIRVY